MLLNYKIFRHFKASAETEIIKEFHLGLGYSAVTLANGGCGLCYTPKEKSGSCTVFKANEEFEGESAITLLERVYEENPMLRCLAIALANALNLRYAMSLPDDDGDIVRDLKLKRGS